MASYWQKKLKELEEENKKKKTSTSDYWQKKTNELEEKTKKKEKEVDEDLAPSKSKTKATSQSNIPSYAAMSQGRTTDIAPTSTYSAIGQQVRTTRKDEEKKDEGKKDERTWFNTKLFDDGVQKGDIAKFLLGSSADAVTDALAGFVGSGEKLLDAATTLGSYQAQQQLMENAQGVMLSNTLTGRGDKNEDVLQSHLKIADDVKTGATEFVKKDLYDESDVAKSILSGFNTIKPVRNYLDNEMEEHSIFGEKSDALVQSGGALAGQLIADKLMPGAGMVMMGTSAFGGEVESALNNGASLEEATISGAISAGAEMLSEKLGGIKFGGSTVTDAMFDSMSRNVTDKLTNALLTAGKIAAGASAEGFEEVFSGYMGAIGQKLTYMEDKEIEELFSSDDALESFIGGVVLGGTFEGVNALQTTKSGKNYVTGLTENEQAVVQKEYENRIAEEEQGGKELTSREKTKIYNKVVEDMDKGYISTDTIEEVLGGESYKTYKDTVDSEDAVLKEFEELGKKQNATLAEQARYSELSQQVKDMQSNSQRNSLKTKLGEDVLGLVKGDRLVESYNERTRRTKAFEADLTKYNAKQQETIKKAVESGILNNTNKTHEFVDMIAKVSADKGVPFDFANNQKLKESGFSLNGKTINGFVTKDGITLNMDSSKALNSVTGHEITHVLEGTEFNDTLKQSVFDYAKSKNDYQSRYDTLAELYKDVEGADIEAELTADLVGDYLFTDTDFINNLSTNHRNVFEKIYDEIKYLYKVATAGSKEARELAKVKKAFEDAYRVESKASGDTKYSMSDSSGKQLTNEQNEYFKDSKMRDANGNLKVMYHGSQDAGFHVFDSNMSDDGTSFFFVDRNDVAASYSGTSETYEARTIRTAEDMNNFLAAIGYEQYEAVEKNGKFELLENGDHVATSDTAQGIYEEFCWYEGVGEGDANYKVYLNLTNPLVVDAKGKNWNNISREYSQEVADRYHSLTAEEKAALADLAGWEEYGVFRDEMLSVAKAASDGKLDKTNKDLASAYQKLGGANANLYDAFTIASDNFSEDSIKEFAAKQMNTRDFAKKAKEQGYDGVIFNNVVDNGGYSNGSEGASTVAIAFDSSQIKSVANDKPTKNPDIRYSLSEYTDEQKAEHNKAVVDYFGKTYKWAETGYVLLDGTRLDLSGKHEGAPGGYRTVDHRDIVDALGSDYGDDTYSGSLVQFMSEGNIRISPESNGINLSVKPNKAQEMALSSFVSYARGEVMLDIDDSNGYTVVSVEYPMGTHANKVLTDIRNWFENGTKPEMPNNYPYSLSQKGETPTYNRNNVYGKDITLEKEIAPAKIEKETAKTEQNVPKTENIAPVAEEMFPNDLAPIDKELDTLIQQKEVLEDRLQEAISAQDYDAYEQIGKEYDALMGRLEALEAEANEADQGRIDSLSDADAPPEMEHYSSADSVYLSESDIRDIAREVKESLVVPKGQGKDVNRIIEEYAKKPDKQKLFDALKDKFGTYTESIPDETISAAKKQLRTTRIAVSDMIKGDVAHKYETFPAFRRMYRNKIRFSQSGLPVDVAYQEMSGMFPHLFPESIANPADQLFQMANVADMDSTSKVNHKVDDGTIWDAVTDVADYVDDIKYTQKEETSFDYSNGAFDSLVAQGDQLAPYSEEVVAKKKTEDIAPVAEKYETIKPKPITEPKLIRVDNAEQQTAKIVVGEKQTQKQKSAWKWAKEHIFRHGAVFEDLSLETGNRELQAKFDNIRRAESMAQTLIGKGKGNVSALVDIRNAINKSGKTEEFNYYLYHLHNVDRMTLADRFENTPNKPVYGDTITAEDSRQSATALELKNPEFKQYAEEIYGITTHLRNMLADNGIISKETAELWEAMYPHYVPISRVGDEGLNINVPLDTGRTGVNAPVKQATGGSRDIRDLFDTMAQRIEQTYKAVAKNRFGVELKNTLGTTIETAQTSVDEAIDSVDRHEELLQEGKNGKKPTFTVFENGEKVTFEITEEMYEAMKPSQYTATIKPLNALGNIRRDILTTYSPTFMLTNPIKDLGDVLVNSQHPAKTYATIPEAIKEIVTKGDYYQERMGHGGEQDSYFDGQTKTFKKEKSAFSKVVGFPFEKIKAVNEVIEQVPRMAEYIASRKMGRSIDVSMLDAARVTTNFGAPGDLTNMLNRNGFTFLGASVEGFNQQVRNIKEAKAEGLKGWGKLAAKYAMAGLPALLLNHALWDDDEEYAELSDYVKQNYYVVAKFDDGTFLRIPKGRAVAVIQNAFEQMENLITGNDEVDLATFGELFLTNLAPNNPLDNNILAPIGQAIANKTWYGEDLVPSRLQDLPVEEQFDESTDAISKWLGENVGISPYKFNYLLDQYSGGIGDMILPMLTPKAESGDNTLAGNMLAPLKDKFTTNSVMNNQNISDFYDTIDKLTTNAKASTATDEDILMSKYMNSVSAEMGELYGQKREIQNSNLSDSEKYSQVKEIQQQIVDLSKNALANYGKVNISGVYASVGEQEFRWYEPGEDSEGEEGWRKLTKDQKEKQDKVTKELGISPSKYWSDKGEYDFAYEYPEKYSFFKKNGISYDTYANADEDGKRAYSWAYENQGKYTMSKVISDDFMTYYKYKTTANDFDAKDENGETVSGLKKERVTEYINSLDLDYGQKIIMFRSMYDSKEDRANYNMDIVDYLNSREDISYEEMETILKELGFEVSPDGRITWD